MSNSESAKPYVYQPYGILNKAEWSSGRIYGIGGMPFVTTITGLTKEEADAILEVIIDLGRAK